MAGKVGRKAGKKNAKRFTHEELQAIGRAARQSEFVVAALENCSSDEILNICSVVMGTVAPSYEKQVLDDIRTQDYKRRLAMKAGA